MGKTRDLFKNIRDIKQLFHARMGMIKDRNGKPLQYFCLENPMDRGACGYSPLGHKELDTTERLN